MTDLTTASNEQLAELAAKCLGYDKLPNGLYAMPLGNFDYNPAERIEQAWELQSAAVAKCGGDAFANALRLLQPDNDPKKFPVLPSVWFATADARARTIAAIAALEAATSTELASADLLTDGQ